MLTICVRDHACRLRASARTLVPVRCRVSVMCGGFSNPTKLCPRAHSFQTLCAWRYVGENRRPAQFTCRFGEIGLRLLNGHLARRPK